METQKLFVKPTSRGVRVWLEGMRLNNAYFNRGDKYTRTVENGVITYKLDPEGTLTVSGRTRNGKELSIIDFSATKIEGFEAGDTLIATYKTGLITITKED